MYNVDMGLITTADAADRLGVHRSRVHVLIKEGRLPVQIYGRTYLVDEKDLKLVENRPTGRPSKAKTNGAVKTPAETTRKRNYASREAKEADEAASKKNTQRRASGK